MGPSTSPSDRDRGPVVLGEDSLGALLQFAVDVDVDLFVGEADQSCDPHALCDRRAISPDDVVVNLAVELHRPVLRRSFVGAVSIPPGLPGGR